jgi:hypothetical protein
LRASASREAAGPSKESLKEFGWYSWTKMGVEKEMRWRREKRLSSSPSSAGGGVVLAGGGKSISARNQPMVPTGSCHEVEWVPESEKAMVFSLMRRPRGSKKRSRAGSAGGGRARPAGERRRLMD